MNKNIHLSFIAFMSLMMLAGVRPLGAANANPPGLMAYQGYLVDGNGNALGTTAPKNYDVIFRVWNHQTATGSANLLWSEQQTVTVDKGYFSVMLGEGSAVGSETRGALASVFNSADASDRFIGISVKGIGTGGADADILPRMRLLTSPYSYLAQNASNLPLGAGINGMNTLEFGQGMTKGVDAGKIGYQKLSDGLDITGAGTDSTNRKIHLWAEGGLSLTGGGNFTGGLTLGGSVTAYNGVFGDVGHGYDWSGFAHKDIVGPNHYALLQHKTGKTTLINAVSGSDASIDFGFDNVIKMQFSNAGNLGVGGSAGTSRLTAYGSSQGVTDYGIFTASINGDGSFDSGLSMGYDSANHWSWLYSRSVNISGRGLNLNGGSIYSAGLNGYAGIRTTSPTAPLQIVGDNDFPHLRVTAGESASFGSFLSLDATRLSGGKDWLIFSTAKNAGEGQGKLIFKENSDDRMAMAIDANGYVGVGTVSPASPLTIKSETEPQMRIEHGNGRAASFGRTSGGAGSSGALYLGIWDSHWNSGYRYVYYDGDSNLDTLSDRRMKKDIEDAEPMLDRAMQLQIRRFRWKENDSNSKHMMGVIAQEVQPLFPDLVTEFEDPETKEKRLTVGYTDFGVIALKALQEFKKQHDSEVAKHTEALQRSEARASALESELAVLKQQVAQLAQGLQSGQQASIGAPALAKGAKQAN